MLDAIDRLVDEQVKRKDYPENFPALAEVPVARYTDPDFEAAEMRHMWRRTWLLAGLDSDLPKPGAYLLFEQLGQSIIVIRNKDGAIRAFHNACRHRGTTLLDQPKGEVSRLVCPYHAWCYSPEGRLVAAPEAQDFAGLDKSKRGLVPVRCELWHGMIFINLDAEAETLEEFMAPVAERSSDFPLEGLITKDHYFIEMDCNWKLAYHNFLEAYHLNAVHPATLGPHLDSKAFYISVFGNGHTRLAARKREGKSTSIYKDSGHVPPDFGELFRQYSITIPSFPNFSAALDPCGFALQNFWPRGISKSVMEVRLVGWQDSPDDEAYWATLRQAVGDILDEDLVLFSRMQKGAETGASNLLFGCQEKAPYWFEEELDRRIGAQNIPEGMAVQQVLSGQIVRSV